MNQPFNFVRGEPITVDLVLGDAGSYDPSTLVVVMQLKPTYDLQPPPVAVAPAATFDVAYHPAVGIASAYWRGTIDALTSAGLVPGNYITDAEIADSAGSVIQVSIPQIINVAQSVSTPLPPPPAP